MKIGINFYSLRPQVAGGMEPFMRNLVGALLTANADNTYHVITAAWNDHLVHFSEGPLQKICIESDTRLPRLLKQLKARMTHRHWDLYRCVTELAPDVWFCPMIDLELQHLDIPSVVAVPDIQQEFYPEFFSAEELRHKELTVRPSCQLATEVITLSEFSKRSLVERFSLAPEKVHVIYVAAGPEFDRLSAEESWSLVKQKHGLSEGYLFYPANTWPHKNHDMLILALGRLKKRGMQPRLILSGVPIRRTERFLELANQLGVREQILHLGYLDSRLFPGLYRGALCLVFPSLFEGFGMPLVEAMSTGCPIAASDICSIHEVAGEAAAYFDPRNPDSMADVLERFQRDESYRNQLSRTGLERSRRFTWEASAGRILDIFLSAKARHKPRERGFAPPQTGPEGYFSDGWAGPDLLTRSVELGRWVQLIIEGEATPHNVPLMIRVTAGDAVIGDVQLPEACAFTRYMDLPAVAAGRSVADILVHASDSFVPRERRVNEDGRRLSYRLHRLALVDQAGNAMSLCGRG